MTNSSRVMLGAAMALLIGAGLWMQERPSAAGKKAGQPPALKNVQTGDPQLKSIGKIAFGPNGLLLVADSKSAAVVAIDTGDTGPMKKLTKRIDHVDAVIAAAMGSKPGAIRINDLAVNRQSGKIYLSVHDSEGGQSAILTFDENGQVAALDLNKVRYAKVTLPDGEKSKVANITGVAFANDRVLATGQCREEFASKIFSLPLPLTHGSSADIFSAETYHVSHGRWETKAPIQSFIPYEEDGKEYVVGAFACTPIAKFPVDDVKSGAKVKGTSVLELGSGNRPLDMFTYEKEGKRWIVTNTLRFKKNLFGPSRRWGVRIDMEYLTAGQEEAHVNKAAPRRNEKSKAGPKGVEVVDALFGAVEVDKLNEAEMVVLREGKQGLDLEVAPLP